MDTTQLVCTSLLAGVVMVGPEVQALLSVYKRQLVADVYQAIARAKLDAMASVAVMNQFQQLRRQRGDVECGG
jgi:uncharacterized lipoprotein YajG